MTLEAKRKLTLNLSSTNWRRIYRASTKKCRFSETKILNFSKRWEFIDQKKGSTYFKLNANGFNDSYWKIFLYLRLWMWMALLRRRHISFLVGFFWVVKMLTINEIILEDCQLLEMVLVAVENDAFVLYLDFSCQLFYFLSFNLQEWGFWYWTVESVDEGCHSVFAIYWYCWWHY